MNIPFDLSTKFGPDLKEIPIDSSQFILAREFIMDQMSVKEDLDVHGLRDRYSLLGYICRILGKHQESVDFATKAFELSQKINMILLIAVDQIRLGTSIHHSGDFDKAEVLFKEAISICESFQPLDEVIDFAYQHYAKLMFDKELFEESKGLFQKALHFRKKKGIDELTESTEFALHIVENKLRMH